MDIDSPPVASAARAAAGSPVVLPFLQLPSVGCADRWLSENGRGPAQLMLTAIEKGRQKKGRSSKRSLVRSEISCWSGSVARVASICPPITRPCLPRSIMIGLAICRFIVYPLVRA